jgi:hypothetical protein
MLLRQQDRAKGRARDLLYQMSSRHPSREDQSNRDFQAVVSTAASEDTRLSCVDYSRQDLTDQDHGFTHLSRRKRKDITLISFQEVRDPMDRASSSRKTIFSRSKIFRRHPGS